MAEIAAPQLSSFGATPRLVPRPAYPSISVAIQYEAKTLFWTSGVLGTLLTLALYPVYESVVNLMILKGYNEAIVFTCVLNGMHTVLWMLVNIPLLISDQHGYFQEYKLHRSDGQKPSASLIRENIITALIMQVSVNPILGYYLHTHWVDMGMQSVAALLPTWQDIYVTMLFGHIFNDLAFYVTHRLFHTKALYFLHKQHHQFAGTIAPAAEHANPIEVIVANIFPTFYGVIFFGCKHPWVIVCWVSMRLQETYLAHSGYCFVNTWFDFIGLAHADEAIFHDHHHTSNRGNFGCMLLDHLFGTMDHFAANGCHEGYLKRGQDKQKANAKTK